MFYPKNGENRPSPGFFECIEKFRFFFLVLYFFISVVYIVCTPPPPLSEAGGGGGGRFGQFADLRGGMARKRGA